MSDKKRPMKLVSPPMGSFQATVVWKANGSGHERRRVVPVRAQSLVVATNMVVAYHLDKAKGERVVAVAEAGYQ